MKALVILGLAILSAVCKKAYKLVIYKPLNCYYCNFAEQQIIRIMNQNHYEDILDLSVVQCQKNVSLCRDDLLKPLLVMQDFNGTKIDQCGGVRSKIYFRDWISDIVNKNPIKIEQITESNKITQLVVTNQKEVVQYFINQVERKRKIKNDKFDILKLPYNQQLLPKTLEERERIVEQDLTQDKNNDYNNDKQGDKMIIQEVTTKNNLTQQIEVQSNFRKYFRRITVTFTYVVLIVGGTVGIILLKNAIKNKLRSNNSTNSVRIPSEQE